MPSRTESPANAPISCAPHAALAQDEAVLAVFPFSSAGCVKYSIVKVRHTSTRVQLRLGEHEVLSFDKHGRLGQSNPYRYRYELVRL